MCDFAIASRVVLSTYILYHYYEENAMGKSINIERNRLDYILTDIMPVEISELFSYGKFYDFLLSHKKELDSILSCLMKT